MWVITMTPALWSAMFLDQAPRERFGLCQQRMKRGDNRFGAVPHEVEDAAAPFFGIQAEFMLQTHDVTGTLVGDFCRPAIRIGAAVIDDVDDARVVAGKNARFLNRRDGRDGLTSRQIDGVSRVLGEGC